MKPIIDFIISKTKDNNCVSRAIKGIISTCCPMLFIRLFYSINSGDETCWDQHKSCLTLLFDCVSEKDYESIPYLLTVLKQNSMKAGFACAGSMVEKYPEIHKQILHEGHEILNRTYSYTSDSEKNRQFNQLKKEEKKNEIERADRAIRTILSYTSKGFSPPIASSSYKENIEMYEILKELGYRYCSTLNVLYSYGYGFPFMADNKIFEFPLSTDPANCFQVINSQLKLVNSNKRINDLIELEFFAHLEWLIDLSIKAGVYINMSFKPRDIMLLNCMEEFLNYISSKQNNIWVANYQEVVEYTEKNWQWIYVEID